MSVYVDNHRKCVNTVRGGRTQGEQVKRSRTNV